MNYNIDGTEYSEQGTIKCRHGSGDSEETWEYTVLRDSLDNEVLLGEDKGKWWLYKEVSLQWSADLIAETYEECPVDELKGEGLTQSDIVMIWVLLKERFTEERAPFQESQDAMVIDPAGTARVFVAVPLTILVGTKSYFSARYPAEKQLRAKIECTRLGFLAKSLDLLGGAILIGSLSWGVANGISTPLTAFWYLGVIAMVCMWFIGRESILFGLCRLVAGAFFIHFATHGVDVFLGQSWEEVQALNFESGRAALLISVLLVLRFVTPKGYAILADGGLQGGGCSWGLFVVGLGIVSIFQDFSYFEWFGWYAGSMPWALVWPCLLARGIYNDWDDYKNAPMAKNEMRSSLFKIADALEKGVQEAKPRAEELAARCDDLEDALRISNDTAVIGLLGCGPCFLKLRDALKQLQELDLEDLTPSEVELVDQDLKTTAHDLKELLASFREWGTPDFAAQSHRVSSFLITRAY